MRIAISTAVILVAALLPWIGACNMQSDEPTDEAETVAPSAVPDFPKSHRVASPDEIQTLIDQLYVPGDDRNRVSRVKSLGTQAIPLLIAELSSERAYSQKFPMPKFPLDDEWAFTRLCDALEETSPSAAAKPLARFATHPAAEVRRNAAILLGKIGTEECVKPLTTLLADDDDQVRGWGMLGIQRGLEEGRRDEKFLQAIFPALEPLLALEDSSVDDEAPGLLLTIDRQRAVAAILKSERFNSANIQFASNLKALNELQISVPHELLLPQLSQLEPISGEFPHMYNFSEALIAYARNPDANAKAYLQKQQSENEDEMVREYAAKGLAILDGVDDAEEFITLHYYDVGFEKLTAEQQNYIAVRNYELEVGSGGHDQYFVNTSGDEIQIAHRGLMAIGAIKKGKVLAAAIALFGPSGPAVDQDARIEQMERFSPKQDEQFNSLDDQFYENEEVIPEMLADYVLENKSHFAPAK
ncbi:DUF4375 domain-containing protein [Blastopirellula sp. JC732]|uniref:DUF4375 domain-containing protein n=1 Tax=Blastopirellula sediminis TaxID=2894196 RepID=A0A9X1MP37_9BACT|nr:DUF4375 domain-containing protein [Blastopirellula sediminis]MCC9606945.1 DUF4375 domain-containing protein [Blastopirellula sediminis]MCC9629760.1 DUF4375 domain-containing protein [Blastopirellula sediminis]